MADKLEGHDTATGASIPYAEDDGALWDRVKLGPYVLPGTWAVSGAAERRIDVKRSKGRDGARFRDQGYEPAPLALVGTLIGASDWNEMVKVAKILTPRKRGVAMEPIAAEHPSFTFLGITDILVKKVHAPVLDGGKVKCTIEVVEWLPAPKPKPKPQDKPLSQRQTNASIGEVTGPLNLILRRTSPATDTPTYFSYTPQP
jgi:hypothetical protein